MNIFKRSIALLALLVAAAPLVFAQLEVGGDLLDNCAKIDGLQKSENYSEARAAAQSCLEGLNHKLESSIGQYFPEEIGDWRRTRFEQNNAMGFSTSNARYVNDGISADVSLTGGMGGGSGLGALAGIASFGMLQAGRKVRVAGLPAAVNPDGTIIVTLEDGSFLNFKSPQLNDADAALEGIGTLVNDFPVADLNNALAKTAP